MKNLNKDCYNSVFSHIYIEENIWDHPVAERIRQKYPDAHYIKIRHYKDVFCRSRQNYAQQHHSQKLILAEKQGNLIYKGAPVCQNFGNQYFYYTSCTMNCIYDCDYCYLKGMYPSANIVLFVNLEDIFQEIEQILKEHPMYLCVSYDTDLPALETITGYVHAWVEFTAKHPDLQIEIRTKSAMPSLWETMRPTSQVIYACTLSPQAIIDAYEHHTSSLQQRIACAAAVQKAGFSLRLCFDPMIYCRDYRRHYAQMLTQVFETIHPEQLLDVSVGSFRISQNYLKKMRKNAPDSAVVQFPYDCEDGYYHYPDALLEEMESFLVSELKKTISESQIFRWKEN